MLLILIFQLQDKIICIELEEQADVEKKEMFLAFINKKILKMLN